MMVVLVDFFEVESELRAYVFSEALFKISDLAGIFEMSTHAGNHASTLLNSKLLLEEVGVRTVEGFLHLGNTAVIVSLLSVSNCVMNIDRFCFIDSSLLLEA